MKIKKLQIARISFQILFFALSFTSFMVRLRILGLFYMVAALIIGPVYCGWLCPYGALQEWLGKLGSLFIKKKPSIPASFHRVAVYLRYVLAAASLGGVYFLIDYDARHMFLALLGGRIAGAAGLSVVAFFLITALFFDRPFCQYICSEGARYGAVSLLRPFTIKRNEETCINCGKCDRACPMQIKVSTRKHVRHGQCINCFECLSACPVDKTLTYGFFRPRK